MRTITLELLRHGPAHNHLLSPVTQYLALCENHSAVTVHLPFEHNQLLHRLRALSYAMGEESRQFQVGDTAQVIGALLDTIPGLSADLNQKREPHRAERAQAGAQTPTHLRLVLSASELALIPFELSVAPRGVPGAGQPLLLQSEMRVCITRETRRVPEEFVEWPSKARILVAAAAPSGFEPVPLLAHLLALRQAIEPWLHSSEVDPPEQRSQQVEAMITVLPHASIEAIEQACANEEFTHVHILAHGAERMEGYDRRFGLALHDTADPNGAADVVSGSRLACALRVARARGNGETSRPALVTLASCNSGNVGSVAGVGASVAHALHEAGIPMVIAAQFPLSFGASVRLVEVLYGGLLWGEDPRELLIKLRQKLYAQFPHTHDWASVTAYASLPPDFDAQLAQMQIARARTCADAALHVADEILLRFSSRAKQPLPGGKEAERVLGIAKERVEAAKARLLQLLERYPWQRGRIHGFLASNEKREAWVLYRIAQIRPAPAAERERDDSLRALTRAAEHYFEALKQNSASAWAAVQFLSLQVMLMPEAAPPEYAPATLWILSEAQSLRDLQSEHASEREWALGNLVELYVLAPLVPHLDRKYKKQHLIDLATQYAGSLVKTTGAGSFGVFSTRRQMLRYIDWYVHLFPAVEQVLPIVMAVVDALPESAPLRPDRGTW